MKKIMAVGAGVMQVPSIKKAHEMGYYVIAVDMNPEAEGFKYADEAVVVNTIDIRELLRPLRDLRLMGFIPRVISL